MKAAIILRIPDPKSSKLVVPYILGVEVGLWSQKTLSESDESCKQFSQKIPHTSTNTQWSNSIRDSPTVLLQAHPCHLIPSTPG